MGVSSPHFKFPVFTHLGFYLLSISLALLFRPAPVVQAAAAWKPGTQHWKQGQRWGGRDGAGWGMQAASEQRCFRNPAGDDGL